MLQTLGKLAEKFPILANSMTVSLRDFLVNPSPILNKLNKYSSGSSNKTTTTKAGAFSITVSDESDFRQTPSYNSSREKSSKIAMIFENCRDTAIENICRLVYDVCCHTIYCIALVVVNVLTSHNIFLRYFYTTVQ